MNTIIIVTTLTAILTLFSYILRTLSRLSLVIFDRIMYYCSDSVRTRLIRLKIWLISTYDTSIFIRLIVNLSYVLWKFTLVYIFLVFLQSINLWIFIFWRSVIGSTHFTVYLFFYLFFSFLLNVVKLVWYEYFFILWCIWCIFKFILCCLHYLIKFYAVHVFSMWDKDDDASEFWWHDNHFIDKVIRRSHLYVVLTPIFESKTKWIYDLFKDGFSLPALVNLVWGLYILTIDILFNHNNITVIQSVLKTYIVCLFYFLKSFFIYSEEWDKIEYYRILKLILTRRDDCFEELRKLFFKIYIGNVPDKYCFDLGSTNYLSVFTQDLIDSILWVDLSLLGFEPNINNCNDASTRSLINSILFGDVKLIDIEQHSMLYDNLGHLLEPVIMFLISSA